MKRRVWVAVHRYVGLAIAGFVTVAGLTGSLLAFHDPLDRWAAAAEYAIDAPPPGAAPLDALALRATVEAGLPGATVPRIHLKPPTEHALVVSVEPADDTADDEVFVDPYTGRIVGSRRWGDISQGWKNLIPFVYRLHYSLALDPVGSWLFGIAALLWTFDCFVGFGLTLPPAPVAGRAGAVGWWRRWARSLTLRRESPVAAVFTWHRASGLWVWPLLLVFAWSGVGFNLRQVYAPVMRVALGLEDPGSALESRVAGTGPLLPWPAARAQLREHAAALAIDHEFTVLDEWRLTHDATAGTFQYRFHSSLDVNERYPDTTVWMDDRTGALLAFKPPSGQRAGNTVDHWLTALHVAAAAGLPYRVGVSVLGVVVAGLAVSGVALWGRGVVLRRR